MGRFDCRLLKILRNGLGGGVSVVTVNDETLASIGDNANVEAGGDVAVLASDDSSYMTASAMRVDGGLIAAATDEIC